MYFTTEQAVGHVFAARVWTIHQSMSCSLFSALECSLTFPVMGCHTAFPKKMVVICNILLCCSHCCVNWTHVWCAVLPVSKLLPCGADCLWRQVAWIVAAYCRVLLVPLLGAGVKRRHLTTVPCRRCPFIRTLSNVTCVSVYCVGLGYCHVVSVSPGSIHGVLLSVTIPLNFFLFILGTTSTTLLNYWRSLHS